MDMPAGALFFLKKSGFSADMPAGALFFLKKSGFCADMPAAAARIPRALANFGGPPVSLYSSFKTIMR